LNSSLSFNLNGRLFFERPIVGFNILQQFEVSAIGSQSFWQINLLAWVMQIDTCVNCDYRA
jgi:hypothetical protein